MYLHYKNVIFMATCLLTTVAFIHSNETLINEHKNIYINNAKSDQNITNVLQLLENAKGNDEIFNTSTSHFLNITSVLRILNSTKAIEILKIFDNTKVESAQAKELLQDVREYSKSYNSSNLNFLNNQSVLGTLLTSFTGDDKAIDILKSFTKAQEVNGKEEKIELTTTNKLTTMLDLNNNIETTTVPTSTLTDDSLDNDEISLSELTNLSYDSAGGEMTMGQNIPYHRSAVNSDTIALNPSIGTEILKNMSGLCGALLGKRISFADPTTLMELPWTVLLLYNTRTRYHCGGSLITTKYVLTAAHCVAQKYFELSGVRLGEYDVTEDPDCAPDLVGSLICAKTIDVDVVKIVVHHEYSTLSFKNDIALLRLDNDYMGRSYFPICLPKPEMTYKGNQATVAGWGATEKSVRSAILLKADVPVLDMSKCREVYRYNKFNESTEICGSGVNEIDVCKGDSGGALFYQETINGRQRYHQLGIISLGVTRCGDKRFFPAVFTRLSGFYNWIENNLEI